MESSTTGAFKLQNTQGLSRTLSRKPLSNLQKSSSMECCVNGEPFGVSLRTLEHFKKLLSVEITRESVFLRLFKFSDGHKPENTTSTETSVNTVAIKCETQGLIQVSCFWGLSNLFNEFLSEMGFQQVNLGG